MFVSFARRHPAVLVSVGIGMVLAAPVGAVPPPDFIINVGTQVAQFFSLALLFGTAIASSLYQSLRVRFPSIESRRLYWVGALVLILLASGVGAQLFGSVLQQRFLAHVMAQPEMQRPESRIVTSTEPIVIVTPTSTPIVVPVAGTTTLPLMLTNARFEELLNDREASVTVLDAREDLEHEYGNFPGSTHIRYADLKAGLWSQVPLDRPIIVLCWSGIRGKEVATFLRSKGLPASFLEDGANGWVDFGGRWQGSIKFTEWYPDKKYAVLVSRDELVRRVQNGAVLVDAREPKDQGVKLPTRSVSIPLLSTKTTSLETAFAQVTPDAPIIVACGNYVDCFEAKLVGVELERRGHAFLGRYDVVK